MSDETTVTVSLPDNLPDNWDSMSDDAKRIYLEEQSNPASIENRVESLLTVAEHAHKSNGNVTGHMLAEMKALFAHFTRK